MAFYQPGQQMRRSYDPPQASQAMTQRAGVGLLFQTSQDGIVVKEVVQSGSAWRSGVIKPGDIIVRVGTVNVQNQPLGNLRELILGEQGTFVTLGFTRGSSQQFYEVKLMRGTAEFLDKHMSGPAGQSSTSQASQQSVSDRSSNITSSFSKSTASTGASSAISSQPSASVSAREQDEIERLRSALSNSQGEVARLRANLRSQELLVERNGEELRTYRETLERRDEENRQGRQHEDRSRQEMLGDFKKRFDLERGKLTGALDKSNTLSRNLNSVLHNLNALQREYATK